MFCPSVSLRSLLSSPRVVLITTVDRVIGMLHIQRRLDPCVIHLRELVDERHPSEMPSLPTHGVVAEAAGELALGAIHLTVQVNEGQSSSHRGHLAN